MNGRRENVGNKIPNQVEKENWKGTNNISTPYV